MSPHFVGVRPRLIPCLLLRAGAVYTTQSFGQRSYVGDLLNTVRIFNELEVDELMVLDIDATRRGHEPNFELLSSVADECFMPLSYGGGVRSVEQMAKLYALGIEKVVLNSVLHEQPELLQAASARFGRQAVMASIDAKRASASTARIGEPTVWSAMRRDGGFRYGTTPEQLAREFAELGAGELLLTSVDADGSFGGYDLDLVRAVCNVVDIPVIASGGAGNLQHVHDVLKAGAQAAAAATMLVRQRALRSVLVHYPSRSQLRTTFPPPRLSSPP